MFGKMGELRKTLDMTKLEVEKAWYIIAKKEIEIEKLQAENKQLKEALEIHQERGNC